MPGKSKATKSDEQIVREALAEWLAHPLYAPQTQRAADAVAALDRMKLHSIPEPPPNLCYSMIELQETGNKDPYLVHRIPLLLATIEGRKSVPNILEVIDAAIKKIGQKA